MQLASNVVKTVYYCYYNPYTGEQYYRRKSFYTLESAQVEACVLQSAGYRGSIVQTFEPLYDEETNSFRDFEVVAQF